MFFTPEESNNLQIAVPAEPAPLITTFILSTLTGIFGKNVGKYLTKWAGLIAGLVFIIIGIKILVEGLL